MCPAALAATGVLAVLAVAAPARADDAQAFELAKNPFDAGRYIDAHDRLSALLDPASPRCDAGPSPSGHCSLTNPDLIEQARALDAASLLALQRPKEADDQIGAIFRANPSYQPSAATFPPEVIDRFTLVRGALSAELRTILEQREKDAAMKRLAAQQAHDKEEAWIAELQRLAALRIEHNSRWIALVPFGIGQFQNGDVPLAVLFAAGEATLGGASLVSVAIINSLASINPNQRTASNQPPDLTALNTRINTFTEVNRVTFAAWGALTLAGVIQAQVAFVPAKVTYHDRPIPARPTLVPVAAPQPGGAVLGLAGTF
jgi:hypothetical protein